MSTMTVQVQDRCRVCGRKTLVEALSLGDVAVSDFVQNSDVMYAPLVLAVCSPELGGCSLVQLAHRALPGDLLYRRYWYRSGTNERMRQALRDVASSAERIVGLRRGDLVLDIGSNDNTLLEQYTCEGLWRIGFEPAGNVIPEGSADGPHIVRQYFSAKAFADECSTSQRARVVTAIAMFYDLDAPHEFLDDVVALLADDGLFIVQMAYLPLMLERNCFDNICHEHVTYFSLLTLERVLREHDLVIKDVEINDVNGGSFRTYIQRAGKSSDSWPMSGARRRIEGVRRLEEEADLASSGNYQAFGTRIDRIRQAVRQFVDASLNDGHRIHGYGASTKGNTLLQHFGLTARELEVIADRNPEKWGRRTVGTNIPIVSEEASRADVPDYYFVLPWHFRAAFLEREQEFLERGGHMIFPLPWPVVVGSDGERVVTSKLPDVRT